MKEQADTDIPMSNSTQEDGEGSNDNTSQQDTSPELHAPRILTPSVLRRSDRTQQPPRWMDDYVSS